MSSGNRTLGLPSSLWRARLSRRIVFWIFLSIWLIEAIILVPSLMRQEREPLAYLRSRAAAQAEGILSTPTDLATTTNATVPSSDDGSLGATVLRPLRIT